MKRKTGWALNAGVCRLVLVAFCLMSLIPANPARAGLTPSRLADGAALSERSQMLETVRQALEKEVVAQRLADYGLTPEEVEAKLPQLSNEQLHQVAGLSDSLGEGGILGTVIAVLLVVLLVVVILKIADREIVIR